MDKEKITKNVLVETYAEDMAKVLENDKEGLIKKIIHGEEEHQAEKKNLSPESKKNKIFMIIGMSLIFLALLTLSYFAFRKNVNTVPVQQQFTPIIFNDNKSLVEVAGLDNDGIMQAILNKVKTSTVKDGGVDGIYLTENKQSVWLRKFVTLIKSSFVPGDNTFFVSDNFLMGIVKNKVDPTMPDGSGFFILLKMRSIADIFGAMRSWENKMLFDLHRAFGIDITKDTNYLFTKNFDDGIVENKNARILHDKDGKIVIAYVFADENSVIISDSQKAVNEIMLRLASAQKKQ